MKINFALVDDPDVSFGPEHEVLDMDVCDAVISHDEGGLAHLAVQVRNPKIGLLAGPQWCILSAEITSGVPEILFRGRLVGVPTDILGEIAQLEFVARPVDYFAKKVLLAETMRDLPMYDPVFVEAQRLADPNTVLESRSASWHVDRVTLEVTASDFLVGEDGEITFEDRVPYDSLKMNIVKTADRAVRVIGTVNWTQRTPITNLRVGAESVLSYTGESLISDWPKPGVSIGGGWKVGSGSRAVDVHDLRHTFNYSVSNTWRNKDKEPLSGNPMTNSESVTFPLTKATLIKAETWREEQIGIVDPFSIPPTNIPAKVSATYLYVPLWLVATNLNVTYQASRQRTEIAMITLFADVQPVLSDPSSDIGETPEDIETIDVQGTDVGQPIINVRSSLAVRSQTISIGTVIQVPAQEMSPSRFAQTYQIAIQAGTTSAVSPSFREIPGEQTTDGTVVWVSTGQTISRSVGDWEDNTQFFAGQIILPLQRSYLLWSDIVPPNAPYTGEAGSVSIGQIIKTDSVYQQCTQAGSTGLTQPTFATTRGLETTDGGAIWTCIGPTIPDGTNYQLCVTGGLGGLLLPEFTNAPGTSTTDGAVTWIALGPTEGGIAIPIGDPARASYFSTDRGVQSLEYLIAIGRSRLAHRSRAVHITVACGIETAPELSCRKSGVVVSDRIPGGSATGKIVSYKIIMSAESGNFHCEVTMACAVGRGTNVVIDEGTPDYCDDDYVESDYQHRTGELVLHSLGDTAFAVPKDDPVDDGLRFPLTRATAIKTERWHGSTSDQEEAIARGVINVRKSVLLQKRLSGLTPDEFVRQSREILALGQHDIPHELAHHAIWKELEFNPVAGQQYTQEFAITTSPLTIVRQINLEFGATSGVS